jgi:hypothetical protein
MRNGKAARSVSIVRRLYASRILRFNTASAPGLSTRR